MDEPLWWITKDGDRSCLAIYQRHYSAAKAYKDGRPRYQFVGPGTTIVLRTADASALFVWREYIDDTIPKQEGIECAVFRNEGQHLSSELCRQADAIADFCWLDQGKYTKIRAEAVRSRNPGYCFLMAGWKRCAYKTKSGLTVLERLGQNHGGGRMAMHGPLSNRNYVQRIAPFMRAERLSSPAGNGRHWYIYDKRSLKRWAGPHSTEAAAWRYLAQLCLKNGGNLMEHRGAIAITTVAEPRKHEGEVKP